MMSFRSEVQIGELESELRCTLRQLGKAETDAKSWIDVYKRLANDKIE